MNTYNNALKVKDALPLYFSRYHFIDGGYNSKWFKIKLGPVYIPLPNIKMRVDAVKIHDIHHLVTEYEANMKGEVEIGAWEIASGCFNYPAAWILNLGSFSYGMIFHPRYLLLAFLRGRKCKTNLYYDTAYDETLLDKTIGELRKKIESESPKNNSSFDYLVFLLYCLLILTVSLIFFLALYKFFTFLLIN